MTEVLFYHLERAKLQNVLPGLLEKTLDRQWKGLIFSGKPDRLSGIDDELWTFRDESFLPHATSHASADPAREPILLTVEPEQASRAPNQANILFLIEGAELSPQDMSLYERCVVIFDGRDDEALQQARALWKIIRDFEAKADTPSKIEFAPTYWRQSAQGRWEKQA